MSGDFGPVVDNKAAARFELNVKGHIAAAYYERAPGAIILTHTEVPKELGGQGVGSVLAKGVLDSIRAAGLKAVPNCSFIAGYIGKHPEFRDLL